MASTEGKEILNNKNGKSPLSDPMSDDEIQIKKNLNKPNKQPKSEFEEKIRVGKDYQVIVPEMNPKFDNYPDKALLVWSPSKDIPENKLDEYIELAKEKFGYNVEQALGMLFWHKHDLQKAVLDLQNFTPFPDEWSKEDRILFEQAYQFHGKCFHRIRQMLPDKSIASLVKFYYSWKKARTRSSTERHEKKNKHDASENGSENGSPNDSDVDDKKKNLQNDSENDVKVLVGDIEEIIGINNQNKSPNNKTSIMTTSTNKAHKRKNEDEIHEVAAKKILSDKPEITITLKAKDVA